MRLIKTPGLTAMAAVAAMMFVGATSASAADTQLCNSHSALTCGSAATSVGMNNTGQGVGTFLSNLIDVLCLTISGTGTPLGLANPQQVHITALSFTNCGTKSAHTNCTITVFLLPLANLLKTGLDHGALTWTDGEILIKCNDIDIWGLDIHCVYDATDLAFLVGAQYLTADDTGIDFLEGDLICPDAWFLDALLRTTANRYVLA